MFKHCSFLSRLTRSFFQAYAFVIILGGTNNLMADSVDDIAGHLLELHNLCHQTGAKTLALTLPGLPLLFPQDLKEII